jgi:hypothetical protein
VSYALGIELASDGVRVASMSSPASLDEAVEEHPPVLFCEGTNTWAGRDALEQGAGKTQGMVNDVVAGFTVDRLFLTAGRLLTPDQAMRELIWGIACRPARVRQAWPDAVTVTFPAGWDRTTVGRAEAIAMGLGLQRTRVLTGTDAASAAADAFSRVPAAPVPIDEPRLTLPNLQADFPRERPPEPEPVAAVPHQTKVKSSRNAIVASVAAIIALVAVLGVLLALNHASSTPTPTTAPAGTAATPTR